MRVDNLVHIGFGDSAIPDCIGIDHNVWPMIALIEASSLVGPHRALEAALRQFDFEHALEIALPGRIAAPARVRSRPLVATNEDVFLELWHELKQSYEQQLAISNQQWTWAI